MKKYRSIIIDKDTFEILDGTKGIYPLKDIVNCDILNEKAKKRGKQEPFLALMGVGPTGIFQDPYLFVGIRIRMKDNVMLAVYISEKKTQVGTDQYTRDRKEAKEIVKRLDFIKKTA
ncbi:MAG: hypothetical protein HUJ53_01745 [Holdemanella sp.]|nr:hypothetical protein [Holdemanella sp.]